MRTCPATWIERITALTVVSMLTTSGALHSSIVHAEAKLPGARSVVAAEHFASLQQAIDALPDEGGVVQLPPGKFEIAEPLLVTKGDVLIQGAGGATHIHNTNEEGKPALVLRRADGKKVPSEERLWRAMLSNFRLTGNDKSGHGIEAIWIQELFIQGVTVSYHGGNGIHLQFCEEDARISDCLMTYNKQAGLYAIGAHDTIVSANHFEENLDAVQFIDGFNLCMSGNNIDDHLRHGVVIEKTYGSVVASNMIEECEKGTGIVLARDCYGITLSANVIAHNRQGINLQDAHGCSVSANTFTVMYEEGLRIGPQSGRITVTGNSFGNNYIGQAKYKRRAEELRSAGVVLAGSSNNVIAGNQFSSLAAKAIRLEGEGNQQNLVSGNLFNGIESDQNNLQNSLIENNLKTPPEPTADETTEE